MKLGRSPKELCALLWAFFLSWVTPSLFSGIWCPDSRKQIYQRQKSLQICMVIAWLSPGESLIINSYLHDSLANT